MFDEKAPLIGTYQAPPTSLWGRLREKIKGQNATLLLYLFLVVVSGTTNRVTFKLMQYSTINYSYFDSQITTFFYIPINFAVIFIKMFYTKTITPQMRQFPVYKFAIMGFLDSLQGFLIVVGGAHVPGIMQSLMLQGAVPVTMIFSLFMLRPGGCANCKAATKKLNKARIPYEHTTTLPKKCDGECICKVTVNGLEVDIDKLDADQVQGRLVVLETSSRGWLDHILHFYLPTQYIGAVIIMIGIVVSMWGSLMTKQPADSGSVDVGAYILFFSATIPTAVSGVYKEIAFRGEDDLDVWYLNGWVALFQFLFGLTYAPLAATYGGIAMKDIPINLYQGLICWLLQKNTIVDTPDQHCATLVKLCTTTLPCCDSCDGSIPGIASLPAFWAMLMYMCANIAYNIFLVLVIKYGSAALMYISSTIVLPLGSLMFTIRPIMKKNAQPFTAYSGAGLGVILTGLIIYRFLGKKSSSAAASTMIVGLQEPIIVERMEENPAHKPRTRAQIRNNYYTRLGLSPELPDSNRGQINL